jgi:phage baseplate assembly protein W
MLIKPKEVVYKDISWSFEKHPHTGDLISVTNEQSITQSIKTLVLLEMGEIYGSDKGAGVEAYFFELIDPITAIQIKNEITRVIEIYEPRIVPGSLQVNVIAQPNQNGFLADIIYTPYISEIQTTVNMFLSRVR